MSPRWRTVLCAARVAWRGPPRNWVHAAAGLVRSTPGRPCAAGSTRSWSHSPYMSVARILVQHDSDAYTTDNDVRPRPSCMRFHAPYLRRCALERRRRATSAASGQPRIDQPDDVPVDPNMPNALAGRRGDEVVPDGLAVRERIVYQNHQDRHDSTKNPHPIYLKTWV